MNAKRHIMVTGGAGFIGSHVVRRLVKQYPDYLVVNVDKLTYAGNPENLADVDSLPNYRFEKADITDAEAMERIMHKYDIDGIIHLAAESHVDRSISDPLVFARTNVMGTLNLLETARRLWQESPECFEGKRFYHISTDEVYGALEMGSEMFVETTRYDPHSPYSASKASSDHFVRAYHDTYGMPTIVTNCSNNYGPNQFPEKLIPLFINNIRHRKPLPVYGKGLNVRDWLYVEDHCKAIDLIIHKGRVGEVYNIGGHNEKTNIEIVRTILHILGKPESLITYVSDRKGHDLRYAIDPAKIHSELGWLPETMFEDGIVKTVHWYLENKQWWQRIISGEYKEYYKKMYENRE